MRIDGIALERARRMAAAWDALLRQPETGPLRPCDYRCGMCGGIFGKGWSDEEAQAEAEGHGIDLADAGLVCDDCYKLTPWGR